MIHLKSDTLKKTFSHQILIVDYNKLGIKRENILSSLREWFDEVKNDIVTETVHPEDERLGEEGQESQVAGEENEEEYGEEESGQDDDIFKNNHDLIGVEGILRA